MSAPQCGAPLTQHVTLGFVCLLALLTPFSSARYVRKRCHGHAEIDVETSVGVKLEPLEMSRVTVDSLKGPLEPNHEVSLEFKASSKSGLLFYARRRADSSQFMSLHLDGGFLFYTVRCPKAHATLRLPNNNKFDDNTWHKVSFRRRSHRGVVEVDGKKYFRGYDVSCDGFDSLVVGGVEPGQDSGVHHLVRKIGHFEGCVRHLRTSSRRMGAPRYHAVSGCA